MESRSSRVAYTRTPSEWDLDRRYGGAVRAVWGRLYKRSNWSGPKVGAIPYDRCPYREELSAETGYSLSSVDRALKFLEQEGWLEVIRTWDAKNHQRKNSYRLLVDWGSDDP